METRIKQIVPATALVAAILGLLFLVVTLRPEDRAAQGFHGPEVDYYRARGLPELYGSECRNPDRPIIGRRYTHSIVSGEDWRGSANPSDYVDVRGKYGEDLRVDSYGIDRLELYAFDYYARGRPGELVVIGRPHNAATGPCLFGELTDERLRDSDDMPHH